jgi:hypothetical protein
MPRVEHLDVAGGNQRVADLRTAVDDRRLAVLVHDGTDIDHLGVGAAAAESPGAVEPVATVTGVGPMQLAGGGRHAGDGGIEVGEERSADVVAQHRGEVAALRADHRAPSGGPVGGGEFLEDGGLGEDVGLGAAP